MNEEGKREASPGNNTYGTFGGVVNYPPPPPAGHPQPVIGIPPPGYYSHGYQTGELTNWIFHEYRVIDSASDSSPVTLLPLPLSLSFLHLEVFLAWAYFYVFGIRIVSSNS